MRVDERGKPHEAAARGAGGRVGEGKRPHAEVATAQKIFVEKRLPRLLAVGQPRQHKHHHHVQREADQRRVACRGSEHEIRAGHSSSGRSSIGSSRMKRRQNQIVKALATNSGSNQPITVQRGRPNNIRTGVSVSAAYAACEL